MSSPTTASSSSSSSNLLVSILTITIILTATVILSVFLCIILRHINRRCASPSSSPASCRVTPENPSLPIFTYGSIKRRTSNSGDCAVCLSRFEVTDRLRLLPLCCHAFHVECIDTWLRSNRTCPLCRSPVDAADDSQLNRSGSGRSRSFRLEIGSVSRRDPGQTDDNRGSYSIGSLDYVVDEESEVAVQDNKEMEAEGDVASGRSWLMDYVDRLSSRAMSFRGSGRFFTGSRRMVDAGDYDMEAGRVGEEISEMFRWFSGV